MTPTQLRAFAAVVRNGSVKAAAAELDVTEAAVSLHVGQLRREFDDKLFTRTASGLAFTPGGLRLASRAAEILGLQDRTVREVSQAGRGRRLLRIAASDLFAEHAAPGLIELFSGRADDLDLELSVQLPSAFAQLLANRSVDLAIGPQPRSFPAEMVAKPFLNYEVVLVASPEHPLAGRAVSPAALRIQNWLLGPSAAGRYGVVPAVLRGIDLPEDRQRIFQSSAASLEEAKRGKGIALAVRFAVADDLKQGRLVQIDMPAGGARGTWIAYTIADPTPAAAELMRFITTPRATQAMLRGAGASIGRFRPAVHVTLWN